MCFAVLKKAATTAPKCRNKTPGLSKIYFADVRWIPLFPNREDHAADPVNNKPLTVSDTLVFDTTTYPEAGWYQWDVQRNTGDLKDNLLGESGGKYLQTEMPFNIAGHEEEMEQAIEWAMNLDLVALATDKAGKLRLVGDKVNPLEMGFNSQYGLRAGDFTGYEFIMRIEAHPFLHPYYTGAITPLYTI